LGLQQGLTVRPDPSAAIGQIENFLYANNGKSGNIRDQPICLKKVIIKSSAE
jgi:hypothetical protein